MVSGPDGKSQAEKRAAAVNQQRNTRVAATSEQGRKFLQNQAANANLEELRRMSQAGVGRDILSAGIQQGIASRARAAGFSESQAKSIVKQEVQLNQLKQQAQTLQQRAIAEQARIKVNQLAKKNEKILREIKAVKDSTDALTRNRGPSTPQLTKLIQNNMQKERELREDLARNNRTQVNLLGITTSRVRNVGLEEAQRSQTQSPTRVTTPRKGSTALGFGGAFSFTPSSLRESTRVQGPQRQSIFPSIESSFNLQPRSKPVKSDQDRFFEGLAAPITNIKTQSEDFFGGLVEGTLESQPLGTPGNILGLPQPTRQRPLKETASSQIFSGRSPNLKDPAILGSAITEGAFIFAPVAATKVAPRISTGITTARQKGAVTSLAKSRKSEGVFNVEKISDDIFAINRGTEGRSSTPGRTIRNRLEIFSVGKKKGADFTQIPKKVSIPKQGKPSDTPLTIVKFGKRSQFGKDPEVIDFKGTSKPVNNPQRTVVTGDIEDFVGKSFGLSRRGRNVFAGRPGPEQRASLRDAEQFGKVRTFAEGNSAPLSKVRSGDLFDFTGQGAIKTKVAASKANQFGQRRGTVGGPAGKGIDVGSKAFDRELTGLGLGGKRGASRFDRQKTPFDTVADDIAGGGSKTITAQQKSFIKQSFGKTGTKTKQKQSTFGTPVFSQQSFDQSFGVFTTPQSRTKKPTSKLVPPATGALFSFGKVTPQKQKDTTVGLFQPVKEKQLDLFKPTQKQRLRLDSVPIFRTGSRLRSDTGVIFRQDTPARQSIRQKPPPSLFQPPVQPPREQPIKSPLFGFGPNPFFGFGFDIARRRNRKRGQSAFELNTAFNPVDPFGGKVEGFGGIIRTRTDRELEAVDDLFVGEAKKQSRKKKGFFFAGFDIFGTSKKNSKNSFDFF